MKRITCLGYIDGVVKNVNLGNMSAFGGIQTTTYNIRTTHDEPKPRFQRPIEEKRQKHL